jgi:hypothetical protein
MTESSMTRERIAWTAAVAMLATGAGWLALIATALLIRSWGGGLPAPLVAARALLRVMWELAAQGAGGVLAVVIFAGFAALIAWAVRRANRFERGVRHA